MKIYTKTGDDGTTSLFDGTRVKKNNARVDLYGNIDELNACIGLALSHSKDEVFKNTVFIVQKDLFALGAQVANPKHKKQKEKSDFDESKIRNLEEQIDSMEKSLPELTSFILPGGTPSASAFHIARTVCRRTERLLVKVMQNEKIDPIFLEYVNRLSDYLFVCARYANFLENEDDIPWT